MTIEEAQRELERAATNVVANKRAAFVHVSAYGDTVAGVDWAQIDRLGAALQALREARAAAAEEGCEGR